MATEMRPRRLVGFALALIALVLTPGAVPVAGRAAAQPTGLERVAALAADGCNWLVLSADGSVWGWGYNSNWNLGVTLPGGEIFTPAPVSVAGLDRVRGVACGQHGLAVRDDGTVWAWGGSAYGQVGVPLERCPNHKEPCSKVPVQVPGLGGIEAVAATDYSSFALGNDGSVWAWGQLPPEAMGDAELGHLPLPENPAPVRVKGLDGVVAISAIANRLVALGGDGTIWAWGGGAGGDAPTRGPDIDDIVAVSAGGVRNLALTAAGAVWAWGDPESPDPAPVEGLGPMTAVAGGGPQSAAVAADGTVWIWGSATIGGPPKPPAQVEGLADVVAIAMTDENAITVLKADGTVWSRSIYNQVQPVPAPATGTPTP